MSGDEPEVQNQVDEYLRSLEDVDESCQERIIRKLKDMPPVYRKTYLLAVTGKAQRLAIKAHCSECGGWSRKEVTLCPCVSCALWPYRPYRPSRIKSPAVSETAN
jgi:hypothetical protein